MNHDPTSCPSRDHLSLLAQGLVTGLERERLERHVARCQKCARELTRLVDERPGLELPRRYRRFPWVPVVASCTVLAACAIAWVLSGGGRYIELAESGRLLSFSGSLRIERGPGGRVLSPELGLSLAAGDRMSTPDRETRAHIVSATGVLYRYDSRGETMMARLGPLVASNDPEKRQAELIEVAAAAPTDPAVAGRLRADAPRGNILSRKPSIEFGGKVPTRPVVIEIREEEPRIRARWQGSGSRIEFPANTRALDRGRTFFWKADGMQDEQAFFIASESEFEEWTDFQHRLQRMKLPLPAIQVLETRYLFNRGFHLDALHRIQTVCEAFPDAVWPFEEAALLLDRLGRTDCAQEQLSEARRNRTKHPRVGRK